MYTYKKLEKVDPKNPYAPEFHGTFELSIPISSGTRTRRVIAYVPRATISIVRANGAGSQIRRKIKRN